MKKIIFRKMSLDENIELIKWSYFQKNDNLNIHKFTINLFPELDNLDNNSKNEINNIIKKAVTKEYNNNINNIEKEVLRYNYLWNECNNRFFNKLEDYFNIEFPKKEIIASVGLIPVFPRDIDNYSFSIGMHLDNSKLRETCAHETLHFIWFKKWMSIYPNTDRKELDYPYLIWQYSEMVTDSILNSEDFKEFNFNEKSYDYFYEINNGVIMNDLKKIYSESITINEKIVKGYEYLLKNISR